MAANVDNASPVSDGSPLSDLTHITNALQNDPAQNSRLKVAISSHEPQSSITEGIPAPNDDPHMDDTVFNRLNKQLEAIDASRASRKSLRAELKTANRRLKALRKSYHRSRASYDDAVDPSGSLRDANPTHIDSTIATLRDKSDRDREALEAHSGQIRNIQDALRTAQRALNRSQAEFEAMALQRPLKDDSSHANTDVQTNATNPPLSQHTPASSAQEEQPLLDKYLRRAADVGIFGERLAECNYEYWTAVSQREMRQDRDETLSVSDEDFERHWQIEKEIITQDLDSAIQDADDLLAACQREGLVVEGDDQGQWDADLPQDVFEDAEVVRADQSDDESVLQERPKIVDRVGTWMQTVQVEKIGTE